MTPTITVITLLCMLLLAPWQGTQAFPRHETLLPRKSGDKPLFNRRPSCELGSCGKSCISKRSDTPSVGAYHKASNMAAPELLKRTFRLSNNPNKNRRYSKYNVDQYVYNQAMMGVEYDNQYDRKKDEQRTSSLPCLFSLTPESEAAKSQQFAFFDGTGDPSKGIEITQRTLHGCTCIFIISDRGVWAAHFWESYTHGSPNVADVNPGPSYDAFSERMLDFLRGVKRTTGSAGVFTLPYPPSNPTLKHPFIKPVGPFIDLSLFNQAGDNTMAYIFTPAADIDPNSKGGALVEAALPEGADIANDKWYKYPARMNAAAAVLRHRLPNIGITRVPYVRQGPDEHTEDAKGIVMFQFDPDYDGAGNWNWRLFLENRVVFGRDYR